MSIIDIIIVIILLFGAFKGFKAGGVRSAISLIGSLLVFILAYYLKNPISTLLYENLPFRNFSGLFHGITTLNIIYYESISYLICLGILGIIFKILIKLSGIVDKIINLTIIFTLPNKLLGLVLNTIKYYIYIYLLVFFLSTIPISSHVMEKSTFRETIFTKTPILSYINKDIHHSVEEIYNVSIKYEKDKDKTKANQESLDTLLKYKVISVDSVKKLKEKGKLKFDGIDNIIKKYEGMKK